MNKNKKVLESIYYLFAIIFVIFLFIIINNFISENNSDDFYVINVEKSEIINYSLLNLSPIKTVPKKANVKLGLEYFCTIEFEDSTVIVDILNKYHKFDYEIIRFYTYLIIDENKNKKFDTINYRGMKVYNIEKYNFDKYIKKLRSNLYCK